MLTLVIPSRNNLKYVKSAYESVRKQLGDEVEVILMDDASTDGTWDWMKLQASDKTKIYHNEGPERIGHTVLYDIGAEMATNEIFGIFHADMLTSPNYIKNVLKHLKPGVIVSGTRIEPPLHPPGPEKFVQDFGIEPETFQWQEFLNFVASREQIDADQTTNGVFAPWVMYKKDFQSIGGHDKRVFAPMELEDSDLFNRFLIQGFKMIQSRDAFVYHMTCRGSRFKDGVKIVQEIQLGGGKVWKRPQDSEEYTKLRQNKFREWWRKWHMDVLHDSNMLPIVNPRYNTGFIVDPCPVQLLPFIEPWCDTIYVNLPQSVIDDYVAAQQAESKFAMMPRVRHSTEAKGNDILVWFDGTKFAQPQMEVIKQLPLMIQDSGEQNTIMTFDIFTIDIRLINPIQDRLVHADNPWYVNQLYGSNKS
jgi:glycosyltransferase involved in cell wall biosynthesis